MVHGPHWKATALQDKAPLPGATIGALTAQPRLTSQLLCHQLAGFSVPPYLCTCRAKLGMPFLYPAQLPSLNKPVCTPLPASPSSVVPPASTSIPGRTNSPSSSLIHSSTWYIHNVTARDMPASDTRGRGSRGPRTGHSHFRVPSVRHRPGT